MNQQNVYSAYKKIINTPFTPSVWDEELSVLNENIEHCDEKIIKDVLTKGLNNFNPGIITFMEKASEHSKLTQSMFYDLSLLFINITPLTFKQIISFQEISKFIFSHELFLCDNEIFQAIIKNKHYSLFSLIPENKKQCISDNDKATGLLFLLESEIEGKEDYPNEIIDYLKNNLNIQKISDNIKEKVAVGFLENNFNAYSQDFLDLKPELIKQNFKDNASAIFKYIHHLINKEIAREEKEKSSLIFGDIFIYSEVFRDSIRRLRKHCDLFVFDNENNNLFHGICQNYSLYSTGFFISKETKDLLFEKNKYGFIPLDFVFSRRDPAELKWLEYMLNNIKVDIEGKQEIKEKVSELLAKCDDAKKLRHCITKDIELSDNDIKEIEELLDVNYEANEEEQTKNISEIVECIKIAFKFNDTKSEKLQSVLADKIGLIENSQFYAFVMGCAANFFYIKNKDKKENALQTYAFVISKIKSITCFEAVITNLIETSILYEKQFNLEEKKQISYGVLMEYKNTVTGNHFDQLKDKLINSISGFNLLNEEDKIYYEKEFGRINRILFVNHDFLNLLKKINDDLLKVADVNDFDEEEDYEEVFYNEVLQDASFLTTENDRKNKEKNKKILPATYDIYTDEAIKEFEQYSKEFKSDNKSNPVWIKKLRERGGSRIIASTDSLKTNIDLLREKFPNFSEFIDFIEDSIYLNTLGSNDLYIPPALLVGKPGIGKTFFLDTLADYAKISYNMFNMESISASWVLKGIDGTWQDASPGLIFANAFKSDYANTMFILDEIDKTNTSKYSVENVLLPLLEKYTAMNYKDEFVPVSMDLSKIIWLATANDIDNISSPIKSRFDVIKIPFPTFKERKIMTQSIYTSLITKNEWGKSFNNILSETILDAICEDANSNRDMRKNLQRAMGRCAKRDQESSLKELIEQDFGVMNEKKVDDWDIKKED